MTQNIGPIVVLSYSGNVGKTTLTHHLLRPRFADGNAKIVSIETINDDMESDAKVRAQAFRKIIDEMELNRDLIVDVGASNVEMFLERMTESEGSHEAVGRFVIPVMADQKQQRDTIQTVLRLQEMGVTGDRIILILNRIPSGEEVSVVFDSLLSFINTQEACTLSMDAIIEQSELFDLLRVDPDLRGVTIKELAEEDTDAIRGKLADLNTAENADEKERKRALNRLAAARLARRIQRSLDDVYDKAFQVNLA